MVSEAELDAAWNAVLAEFAQRGDPSPPRFDAQALGVVRCAEASELLVELCAEHVRSDIDARLVPAFWRHFAWARAEDAWAAPRRVQCALFFAFHELVDALSAHVRALSALEAQLIGSKRVGQLLLHAYLLLLACAPAELDYPSLIVAMWDQSFRDHCVFARLHGALPSGLAHSGARAAAGGGSEEEEDEEGAEDDDSGALFPSSAADRELLASELLPSAHAEAVAHFVAHRASTARGFGSPSLTRGGSGGGLSAALGSGSVAMEVEGDGAAPSSRAQLELLLGAFAQLCAELASVGWLRQLEEALSLMLSGRVHAHVHLRCAGQFEKRLLPRVQRWLSEQLLPWLHAISDSAGVRADELPFEDALASQAERASGAGGGISATDWPVRLLLLLHETLGSLRIGELFDVILDFPDSKRALEDLAECLRHTHQHQQLASSLRASLEARLLRPGADTAQVIDFYIQTIQALHMLDSSGVLLQRVSWPVCEYLQRRDDTVRQIVHGLLDDESAALFGDVEGAPPLAGADADDPHNGLGLTEAAAMWSPLSIDADRTGGAAARARGDVLSLLIGIYGSKEVFVAEYRAMLADKALAAPSLAEFDTDRERKAIELLKVRFGEAALMMCEVMLRDLADSRRLARTVGGMAQPRPGTIDAELSVAVISRLSWPPLTDESFAAHPAVERALKRFERQYAHYKSPRKLLWKRSLGSVTLDLELGGQLVADVQCTPAQATMMLHFAERERWTLAELARTMELDAPTVRKRVAHWINRGFLVEVEGAAEPSFEVAQALAGSDARAQAQDDEGAASAVVPAAAAVEAEMQIYGSFVTNMLTNLGTLSLGRIHNMLKMFVAEPVKYDKSEQELNVLLMNMVDEEKLEFVGGQFRLKK